jgi:hypothetical protein
MICHEQTVKDTNPMNDETKLLSNGLPPPPIPQRLREMLQDYPGHLARLQEELNYALDGPRPARGSTNYVFELIIWALEGQLGAFTHEAQDELEAAQVSGDAEAIGRAKAKEDLMFDACSSNGGMRGLHVLWDYFEEHKEMFK